MFRLQWRGHGQTDINTVDCGDGGGDTQLGGDRYCYTRIKRNRSNDHYPAMLCMTSNNK